MAHKAQLENKKYRNWVRAALGFKYVKEGLEPFCTHFVNQQHNAILNKVKQKNNLSTVSCGLCNVHVLQPDHVQSKPKQCPLRQTNCNCLHPRKKIACPNKVCGTIYDEIIRLHGSTPPALKWKNTDAKQWCTEPWAVAKCFIHAPGYESKNTAAEFDCIGLLHVLLNNIEFQNHINCVITGTDVFSRVRTSRNDIFHSDNMELEDTEVYCYIDDMIKLLEDDKEIKHRQESKDAVKKLQELQQDHFTISTEDVAEVRRVASKKRKDFQKKLVKLYERDVIKVTPLPRLHKNKRNVDDMYVPALMTKDIKNRESGRWEEVRISMDTIFRNNEEPAKCIYVIGDAGSGKSTFCKMLVYFWCIAHSHQEGSIEKSNMVTEMERYDFLFYVSLRYYSDCVSIENFLEKSYYDPALGDILQNDSSKCLVVLDGLDEWNLERKYISQFQTSGFPGRELDADYTIITTSRQWKFDALSLSESKVGKKIKLHGIDGHEMRNLTVKTVETLNDILNKNKNAKDCIVDLEGRQVSDISKTPLMLQQLVCLWFNDKLQGNSKCAIYGSMLYLFLEWKALETSEVQDQLYVFKIRSRNTHVKQYLSYLAYETLFDQNKESTLNFSSSKIDQLSIPHDVIKDYLDSGILKEERNVSLSENMQSTISFFHKSVQEYLAAVYIANQFKEMLLPRDGHALIDVGKLCVDKYFGSCKTVADILEQSNVLIMLCGLDVRLLTKVSNYIYNVSLIDKVIVKERNEIQKRYISDHSKLIIDIQSCIFKCIEEVSPCTQLETVHSHVYIADLYVSPSTDLLRYCKYSILERVISAEIVDNSDRMITRDEEDDEAFHLTVKHLTKCDQLKVVKFEAGCKSDQRIFDEVITILETNVHTLENVGLFKINDIIASRLVSTLPEMRQLTTLQMESSNSVPHSVISSLNKFLNHTTRLQHITLGVYCEKSCTYNLNLSKYKKLQHVEFMYSSLCMVRCSTDHLEICKLSIASVDTMIHICHTLFKAGKLKELYLYNEKHKGTEHIANTEELIKLLSSLVSLSTLELWNFIFTENILAHPCDMKNLNEIRLNRINMSMTTWCKFIDSLPELPHAVKVSTYQINIGDGKEKDVRKYVRAKEVFHVTNYDSDDFDFTTKKTRL